VFKKRQEVYSIKEFLNRDKADKGVKKRENFNHEASELGFMAGVTIPLAVNYFNGTVAHAEMVEPVGKMSKVTDGMYETMLHAFDPLITLAQAIAYPICMVVVLGGALFIMIGNKEKGFTMMQSAGLGYVLVQMTPLVLNILVQAMKSI
jgi:hypothetical protein